MKCDSIGGFNIINNVYIDVIDTRTNMRIKRVEKHNKATRRMVAGIMRYLAGQFTATDLHDTPEYGNDVAAGFIPCYFAVGDGGVNLTDGVPTYIQGNPRVPSLSDDWNDFVNYTTTKMEREFFTSDARTQSRRTRIRKVLSTVESNKNYGSGDTDMDNLYFACEVAPGALNRQYNNANVFITELGLFPTNDPNNADMLAYVKLTNTDIDPDNPENDKTDVLFVRPSDTVIVRWIISIVSVGRDGTFTAYMYDEDNKVIKSTIKATPNLGVFEVVDNTAEESPEV